MLPLPQRDHNPRQCALEIRTSPAEMRAALLAEADAGLRAERKELSPKWFYDAKGSALFEAITELPEYYPTRRERALLRQHAASVARRTRASTVVELGSGSAEKTRLLLNALEQLGTLQTYVPLDVSESALRDSIQALSQEHPNLRIQGIVADFEQRLGPFPESQRRLVAFLGGTIGNFKPEQRIQFLCRIAAELSSGDMLLLGTDLVKDPKRLEAAYNDSQGVTAAFNLNVLSVLNRELGANFRLSDFRHIARFDFDHNWIEMLLCSTRAHRVELPVLGRHIQFNTNELMRTEISAKFEPRQVEAELSAAGFELIEWWTDELNDYALSLSVLRATH